MGGAANLSVRVRVRARARARVRVRSATLVEKPGQQGGPDNNQRGGGAGNPNPNGRGRFDSLTLTGRRLAGRRHVSDVRDILGALRSRARSAANPNGAGRPGGALRCLLSSEIVVVRRARCQSAKVVCVTAKAVWF